MTLTGALMIGLGTGVTLGAVVFGGLWYTVLRLARSQRPAIELAVSGFARLAAGAAALWALAHWLGLPALIGALVGMLLVRSVLTRHVAPHTKHESGRV